MSIDHRDAIDELIFNTVEAYQDHQENNLGNLVPHADLLGGITDAFTRCLAICAAFDEQPWAFIDGILSEVRHEVLEGLKRNLWRLECDASTEEEAP